MFDIHSHILPGVDDGSGNMSDSIEMAQIAAESGIMGIVATPHCNVYGLFDNFWNSGFEEKIQKLRKALKENSISVEIYPGQEIFLSERFEEHLAKEELITLNGSRYILVEFDFEVNEATAVTRLGKIISKGYVPIVAHPERYRFVVENPEIVKKIRSDGCLVQLNAGSLTGEFGRYVQQTSNIIVQNELADFIASDAHSQYSRTPNLAYAHEHVSENFSYDYADILLRINPLKVLNNETV